MTKAGTLAKVVHELLKNVPTEAGATLSRGQAETLAGLAEIAAAVMAEAKQAKREQYETLAEGFRQQNSPVVIQDLATICYMMADSDNGFDIVHDNGAAYIYDVVATLWGQAQAAGYTDGQAIRLRPAIVTSDKDRVTRA